MPPIPPKGPVPVIIGSVLAGRGRDISAMSGLPEALALARSGLGQIARLSGDLAELGPAGQKAADLALAGAKPSAYSPPQSR